MKGEEITALIINRLLSSPLPLNTREVAKDISAVLSEHGVDMTEEKTRELTVLIARSLDLLRGEEEQ